MSRTTHTNLDVKLEKRIDDYWNIDGSRDLCDPWTGSHNLLFSMKKPLTDIHGPGGDQRENSLHPGPDHLWPVLWKSMGKHAKLKEKQKWSEEKIHHNARKL